MAGAAVALVPDLDVLIRDAADPLLNVELHRHFTHSLLVGVGLGLVASVDGVLRVEARATGATIAIRDRATMARILATLAAHQIDVFGATVRRASMEDVYFALESTFAAEQA